MALDQISSRSAQALISFFQYCCKAIFFAHATVSQSKPWCRRTYILKFFLVKQSCIVLSCRINQHKAR